jgi:hypothetical protein
MGRAIAASILAAFLVTSLASAERVQRGSLEVALNGGIAPKVLPRDRLAPVAMTIMGRVRSTPSGLPPQVQKVEIKIAGHGSLATRGLSVCPRARLTNADTRTALRRCGAAQVGRGWLDAYLAVPHQTPFKLRGRILAFNGRTKTGAPAIWLHLFTSNPPIALVLPVLVYRGAGSFSTRLSLRLPRSLGALPHMTGFSLTLSRRYLARGKERSYLRASCPIPPNFTAGFLSFAQATYVFPGGRRVRVESVRSCRALSR